MLMAVLETRRPRPPEALLDDTRPAFAPSPELRAWVRSAFLEDGGPLFNRDHAHLRRANIGFLWTNVPNKRQMRAVAGTAEIPSSQGNVWAKARARCQLAGWFGAPPLHFLITLDAGYAAGCDDLHFAALLDHELYHCAQARDQYDCPRFNKDGDPIFAIRGHDAEEFVGVVRRYGPGGAASGVSELVDAAAQEPTVARARISQACGTCRR